MLTRPLHGLLIIFVLASPGCAEKSPMLDSRFGESFSLIKAQQIRNPAAARNADPVAGIDARAGKSAYDEYQKSYNAPAAPQNVLSIGVGGKGGR